MTTSAGEGRILVWMRDHRMARRFRAAFAGRGAGTVWAASLPEAIAAVDRDFPAAVACTLSGHSPSLIDLETLVAYQVLGHRFVALSALPVWALTSDAPAHAREIASLDLPVRLVPAELGVAALVDSMAGFLAASRSVRRREGRGDEVLLLSERADEGRYLARYLVARGVAARAAEDPADALALLRRGGCPIVVSEDFSLRCEEGSALWGWLSGVGEGVRVILISTEVEWLKRVSPLALPRNVVCILERPVRAQALEATLRRLLRIGPPPLPEPAESSGLVLH